MIAGERSDQLSLASALVRVRKSGGRARDAQERFGVPHPLFLIAGEEAV